VRIKLYLGLACAAGLVAAAACEDNPFIVGRFGVAGGWAGSSLGGTAPDTVRFHFEMELEQDRTQLSGTATVSTATAEFPLRVTGTWAATSSPQADITLELTSDETETLRYVAKFDTDSVPATAPATGMVQVTDTDTLVGVLHGSGLEGDTLRLGRTSIP
jgi:hypothetical protein